LPEERFADGRANRSRPLSGLLVPDQRQPVSLPAAQLVEVPPGGLVGQLSVDEVTKTGCPGSVSRRLPIVKLEPARERHQLRLVEVSTDENPKFVLRPEWTFIQA